MSVAGQISALRTNLSNAYDAIETAGGTVPQNKNAANLATAVATISGGGSANNNWGEVMSGQSGALYDNDITALRDSALNRGSLSNGYLTSVSMPSLTSLGVSALENQVALTSVSFPNVTTSGGSALTNCPLLATVSLPKLQSLSDRLFASCYALTEAILPSINVIGGAVSGAYGVFSGAGTSAVIKKIDIGNSSTAITGRGFGAACFCGTGHLEALIIRSPQMVPIAVASTSVFQNSTIASGTGYIYVPSSLVDTYKAANAWSTYASQIRAIEDYSTDGTVDGDITVS